MSTSLATGIVAAEVHAELEQSSSSSYSTSLRQPPATASVALLPPEGPTLLYGFLGVGQLNYGSQI